MLPKEVTRFVARFTQAFFVNNEKLSDSERFQKLRFPSQF